MITERIAELKRSTQETQIFVRWNLDGSGESNINTGIPFFDHMLTLFAKHGFFDLEIEAKGDIEVDYHHTMEDLGLTMGQVLKSALGDKKGIRRYGSFLLPMDETLAQIALDLSGRPCMVYRVALPAPYVKDIDGRLFQEFFQAFVNASGMNLHIRVLEGEEIHHVFEAIFKGFARALDVAVGIEPRQKGIPSTKGILE